MIHPDMEDLIRLLLMLGIALCSAVFVIKIALAYVGG